MIPGVSFDVNCRRWSLVDNVNALLAFNCSPLVYGSDSDGVT